jgi:hypothetical protein
MTPSRAVASRREIASILAQGILRYRRMAKLGLPAIPTESCPQAENGLELSRESRLHVADGAAG